MIGMKAEVMLSERAVKELGLAPALLLGFLYRKGKFSGTLDELESVLGLSYYLLRKARKILRDLGYIRERRTGYPQRVEMEITDEGRRYVENGFG